MIVGTRHDFGSPPLPQIAHPDPLKPRPRPEIIRSIADAALQESFADRLRAIKHR